MGISIMRAGGNGKNFKDMMGMGGNGMKKGVPAHLYLYPFNFHHFSRKSYLLSERKYYALK
jgi:hypothetical protein